MPADLMIPLFFIVIMYILIDSIDSGLVLMALGLLWLPISFIFAQIIATNGYTLLFGATISNYPMAMEIVALIGFTVPMFAFAKIFYMRKTMMGEKEVKDEPGL